MAVLIPTKKIPQLTEYGVSLAGTEMMEISVTGTSRRITTRDFVLPIDSILTVTPFPVVGSNARQLTLGIGLVAVDSGPGGTFELNATGAVAGPANPTALVGLAPVNGALLTYMRSDAAPAIDQGIAPIWTATHAFNKAFAAQAPAILISSASPGFEINETDGAVDNRRWLFIAAGEQLQFLPRNDADTLGNPWLTVDRTGTTVDSIALVSTALTWNGSPLLSAATAFANPTGIIGLATVNGVATTAMRSDAAPPLSQAIAPTWTAQHIFSLPGTTNAAILISSAQPQSDFNETDAAANNRRWRWEVQGEQFLGRTVNDANSAAVTWLAVDRTLNVVDSIALTSTALTWNGNPLLSTATAFANPTGTIGLATVNGVATTAMRSDAAPPLSQAIAPTWTAQHIFSLSGATNAAILASSAQPQLDWNETDAAANNRRWRFEAQAEQFLGRVVNDANSAAVTWLTVDRTANVIDSVAFLVGGTNTFSIEPTLTTTPVQIRSQRAWSLGSVAGYGFLLNSNDPAFGFQEADAAANNGIWDIAAIGEQLLFRTVADAVASTVNWLVVDRTGTVVDTVNFTNGVLQYAGNEVGLRNRTLRTFGASDNTVAADNGKFLRFNGAGGQTFTMDADIGAGGNFILINDGSAPLSVAATTLQWLTGAAVTVGSPRTLAVGGWMFVQSNGSANFFVWGAGIT